MFDPSFQHFLKSQMTLGSQTNRKTVPGDGLDIWFIDIDHRNCGFANIKDIRSDGILREKERRRHQESRSTIHARQEVGINEVNSSSRTTCAGIETGTATGLCPAGGLLIDLLPTTISHASLQVWTTCPITRTQVNYYQSVHFQNHQILIKCWTIFCGYLCMQMCIFTVVMNISVKVVLTMPFRKCGRRTSSTPKDIRRLHAHELPAGGLNQTFSRLEKHPSSPSLPVSDDAVGKMGYVSNEAISMVESIRLRPCLGMCPCTAALSRTCLHNRLFSESTITRPVKQP